MTRTFPRIMRDGTLENAKKKREVATVNFPSTMHSLETRDEISWLVVVVRVRSTEYMVREMQSMNPRLAFGFQGGEENGP